MVTPNDETPLHAATRAAGNRQAVPGENPVKRRIYDDFHASEHYEGYEYTVVAIVESLVVTDTYIQETEGRRRFFRPIWDRPRYRFEEVEDPR